jgi:hypothetical protein
MAFIRRAELWACVGALAFTGCVITDDDGDTEAGTSSPTTMTMTGGTVADDGGTVADDGGTTVGDGDTTVGPGDTTVGPGDTTEGPGDTTEGPGDTTAGDTGVSGDAYEACLDACEVAAACDKDFPPRVCPESCEELAGFATRDGCVAEFVAQQNCVTGLSGDCAMFFDWLDGVGDPYPCQAEDEALFACEDA